MEKKNRGYIFYSFRVVGSVLLSKYYIRVDKVVTLQMSIGYYR